jgi:hypothetical protein
MKLTRFQCLTRIVSMKNITISLKDELARWLRVHAAKEGKSASGVLAELLDGLMQREECYARAMSKFLQAPVTSLKSETESYPKRDQLHERR